MKRNILLALLAAVVVLSATAVFAAAEPDANVKELWLRCPSFPKDAIVLEFEDGLSTEYTRFVDSMVAFTISRYSVVEESRLRTPDDVEALFDWIFNNEGDEAYIDNISDEADASDFAQIYTYPCFYTEYSTGQNEDTRMNFSLFIFTDGYTFNVKASVAADFAEDYEEQIMGWLKGLKLVD